MVRRLVLDSGAIIALSRYDVRTRALVAAAIEQEIPVIIPAPVVAETTRGTNADAVIDRVLRWMLRRSGTLAPIGEREARLAGRLLRQLRDAHSKHPPPTVDAMIVAVAIARGGGVLLTSDPGDLQALAASNPEVRVRHYHP
jgi:predicted nucleic acid-binding protein